MSFPVTVCPGLPGLRGNLSRQELARHDVLHVGDVLEVDPPVLLAERDRVPFEPLKLYSIVAFAPSCALVPSAAMIGRPYRGESLDLLQHFLLQPDARRHWKSRKDAT